MALFGLLPGGLLVAILLFLNAIAILNEERFLSKSALAPRASCLPEPASHSLFLQSASSSTATSRPG